MAIYKGNGYPCHWLAGNSPKITTYTTAFDCSIISADVHSAEIGTLWARLRVTRGSQHLGTPIQLLTVESCSVVKTALDKMTLPVPQHGENRGLDLSKNKHDRTGP